MSQADLQDDEPAVLRAIVACGDLRNERLLLIDRLVALAHKLSSEEPHLLELIESIPAADRAELTAITREAVILERAAALLASEADAEVEA